MKVLTDGSPHVTVAQGADGRLLDIEQGPDNALYFSDTEASAASADGRGLPFRPTGNASCVMPSRLGVLLVAILALALLLAAPVSAQSQDNTAVAANTKDGKSVFKLAFSVKKATGEVDATNTAVAYASCNDCRTVAAAIQVVLVSDETSVVPENVAIALNYQCTECETLAAAFQFVYGDGQELEFTKEGKAQLHDLKKRFKDLKQRDDLSLSQLATEISVIAGEVAEVVDTETQVKKPAESAAGSTTTTTVSTTTTTATGPTTTSTTSNTSPASTTTTVRPSTTSTTAQVTTTAPVTTTTVAP